MLVLLLLGRRIPTSIRLLLLLLVGAMRRHHHLLIVGVVEDRSSGNPRESHSRVVLTRKSHSRVVLTRESHSRVVVMMVLDRSEHVLLLLLLFVKPVRMLQQLSSTRCSCCTSREDGSILLLLVMVLPMLTGQVVACMPMVVATNASTQQLRMIQRWASRSVKRVNPTARTVAVGAAAVERITRPAMVQQTVSRRSPRTTTTAAAAASVSPVANMAPAEALSCWCVWAHHPTTLHIVSWVQGVQWRHTSTTARSIVAAAPEISGNRPDARCLQHEATLVRASAEAPAPLLLCVSPV